MSAENQNQDSSALRSAFRSLTQLLRRKKLVEEAPPPPTVNELWGDFVAAQSETQQAPSFPVGRIPTPPQEAERSKTPQAQSRSAVPSRDNPFDNVNWG